MYSRILLAAAAVTSLDALAACATNDAAAPGISAQEMQVLTSNYYAGLIALILGGAGPLSIDALRSRRGSGFRMTKPT